jgi:hypothetical protein
MTRSEFTLRDCLWLHYSSLDSTNIRVQHNRKAPTGLQGSRHNEGLIPPSDFPLALGTFTLPQGRSQYLVQGVRFTRNDCDGNQVCLSTYIILPYIAARPTSFTVGHCKMCKLRYAAITQRISLDHMSICLSHCAGTN